MWFISLLCSVHLIVVQSSIYTKKGISYHVSVSENKFYALFSAAVCNCVQLCSVHGNCVQSNWEAEVYLPPSESTLQRSRPIAPPPTVVLIISTPIASNVRCSRSVFENSSLVTKLHPPSCSPKSATVPPSPQSALPCFTCTPRSAPLPLFSKAAPPKQHLHPIGCRHPPWLLKKVSYSLQATITLPSSCAELSTFDHS